VPDTDPAFGARLRLLREERGLSQRDFAKQGGVSRRRMQDYEAGNRPPDVRVRDLARRLRVNYGWLANGAGLMAFVVLALLVALACANVGCAVGAWKLSEPYCFADEWHGATDALRDASEAVR
jgi:DNA-binding XRE family transcriptional regulator